MNAGIIDELSMKETMNNGKDSKTDDEPISLLRENGQGIGEAIPAAYEEFRKNVMTIPKDAYLMIDDQTVIRFDRLCKVLKEAMRFSFYVNTAPGCWDNNA